MNNNLIAYMTMLFLDVYTWCNYRYTNTQIKCVILLILLKCTQTPNYLTIHRFNHGSFSKITLFCLLKSFKS